MYLRHTTRKKDGKIHRYWTLVRSVRVGRRVIQQTVAQLGELDEHGRLEARALARHLIGEPEQARLFDDGSGQLTVPVRLKGIRIERSRQFGDVYLALALWRGTGLAQLCEELLPAGKEQVPWEKIAAVLVTARLCEPSSELHIAEDWYRRTALSDLLQLDETQVNKDRLYRALDELLLHKAAIEAHLSGRCGELFAIDNEVLLYDVTSTYFEGQAQANPLAQRGYSRDHRPDCKQVCIGLVVSFDGFPLGYEVFPGNMHDSRTVQQIVTTMEARHGALGRVWIADRGMSSAANLAWLRETGRRYLVGTPKSELRHWAPQLADAQDWHTVRDGIDATIFGWLRAFAAQAATAIANARAFGDLTRLRERVELERDYLREEVRAAARGDECEQRNTRSAVTAVTDPESRCEPEGLSRTGTTGATSRPFSTLGPGESSAFLGGSPGSSPPPRTPTTSASASSSGAPVPIVQRGPMRFTLQLAATFFASAAGSIVGEPNWQAPGVLATLLAVGVALEKCQALRRPGDG